MRPIPKSRPTDSAATDPATASSALKQLQGVPDLAGLQGMAELIAGTPAVRKSVTPGTPLEIRVAPSQDWLAAYLLFVTVVGICCLPRMEQLRPSRPSHRGCLNPTDEQHEDTQGSPSNLVLIRHVKGAWMREYEGVLDKEERVER